VEVPRAWRIEFSEIQIAGNLTSIPNPLGPSQSPYLSGSHNLGSREPQCP
jgi:hypothetical protein